MSDVFPKWTNRLPLYVVTGAFLLSAGVVAAFWYYLTPKYSRVGYQPIQPVSFSHATHSAQLGLDCFYCHADAQKSWLSNLPSTASCMNCHNQSLKDDPRLTPLRESLRSGLPIPWVQIHKLPDYVFFSHAIHINSGVSCLSCHGEIQKMDVTRQVQPMSMAFCLECHRNPGPSLRPLNKVTDLAWDTLKNIPPGWAEQQIQKLKINPTLDCSGCHR